MKNKENELWSQVTGYDLPYEASSLGGIRLNDVIIKQYKSAKGYITTSLRKDGKLTYVGVHRLVANAFLNHKTSGHVMVVDHINNNPSDNRLINLQVISQRDNIIKGRVTSSKHLGVSKISNGTWKASSRRNRSRYDSPYIGIFKTELEAAKAVTKWNNILI